MDRNGAALQCIQNLRLLPETIDAIRNEMVILSRTIYKNKNQHRRSQYFQYLSHLHRQLNAISWPSLTTLIDKSISILETFVLKETSSHVKWGTLNGILKKQIDYVLRTLQCQLVEYVHVS